MISREYKWLLWKIHSFGSKLNHLDLYKTDLWPHRMMKFNWNLISHNSWRGVRSNITALVITCYIIARAITCYTNFSFNLSLFWSKGFKFYPLFCHGFTTSIIELEFKSTKSSLITSPHDLLILTLHRFRTIYPATTTQCNGDIWSRFNYYLRDSFQ